MTDSNGLEFLLQAAVASADTWFSIHRTSNWIEMVDGKEIEKSAVPGNAHKDHRQALEDAMYWTRRGRCVYLAQGAFRSTAGPGKIYPKALRQEPNLIACRNLYMDIDVKPKAYATTNDALKALQNFLVKASLPCPTIIVGSGNGGIHVYWTLDETFDAKEFRRMAGQLVVAAHQSELMFDQNCTNDPVRLMRVPGTWNFKHATDSIPATLVTLMHCDTKHIKLVTMQKALAPFKPVASTGTHESKSSVNDDLGGGMNREYPPANIDTVATFCPFIKRTLEEGGANLVGEPQWKLAVGLSCHCDDPAATVHRLCHKGTNYNPEATDAKLKQALQSRKDRPSIGPEKCATIHGTHNIPECAACPHLHLGTTPLSVQFKQPNRHANQRATANPSPNSIDLPKPYYRGPDDWIYYSRSDGAGGLEQVCVFDHPLLPGSASVEYGKPGQFVFDTILGERIITMRFPTNIIANNNLLMDAFSSACLAVTVKPDLVRTFLTSFIKMLSSSKETLIDAPAFGWSLDRSNQMGFAFAGTYVSLAGKFKSARPGDGVEDYRATGDDKAWRALAKILLVPERPDLCSMAAATFAAPLVSMTGQMGVLIGLISGKSGIGKSTSLLFGQSVWSKPIVGGLSDTIVYTFAKCSMLRHLPLFYDEIKGEKQIKAMTELAFQLTGGHEKGRANRSGQMRKVNEFKTLCGYCANGSIVSAVREEDKGTDASWLRIFEMRAVDLPNTEEEFAYAVNEHLTALHLNYGNIGVQYAQFLGENHDKLAELLVAMLRQVARDLGADPKVERYWLIAIATVLVGAMVANSLGFCTFPLDAMKTYMYGEFRRMKQEMLEDPNDFGADAALITTLNTFLNEKQPRNMIILNKTWPHRKQADKSYANVLNNKTDTMWGTIEVQVSGDPLIIKISDSALTQWCKRTNRPKPAFVAALKKRVNARFSSAALGSGSYKAGGKENVWVIEVPGTILEETLDYPIHYKFEPP